MLNCRSVSSLVSKRVGINKYPTFLSLVRHEGTEVEFVDKAWLNTGSPKSC